jgi:GTPase SAR1 family protein
MQTGMQQTNRIKLVVVGDPQVGKTTLAKAVAKKWVKKGTLSIHVPFH